MPVLCLVRHTTPIIDPSVPPRDWLVGDEGRAQVEAIVPDVTGIGATIVVTSPEPKAQTTAEILAQALNLTVVMDDDLSEQSYGDVPWEDSREAFEAAVQQHFAHPDQVTLGSESSRDAAKRFDRVARKYADQIPVLVSHGRIMCAWMASQVAVDAFEIWKNLRMPDALA